MVRARIGAAKREIEMSIFRCAASAASCLFLLGACAAPGPEDRSDSAGMTVGVGSPVIAAAETPPVGTAVRDAADDPAIWVDPNDHRRGVILGTDKQAGLYVYGLDGAQRQALPGGKPNNVDLRDGFSTGAGPRVLIAASDRGRGGVALYLLDPATLKVAFWALVRVDLTEPYGLCMARRGGAFLVITNGTDGQVRQHLVASGADGKPVWTEERRFAVATQPEGCVADDARGRLYLGEEGRGIWRFDLAATSSTGTLIAEAPSTMLKPDVEGLALLEDRAGTWLIASSQGDSSFAVWRVDDAEPSFKGRFSVVASGSVDAVTGTDGVAALGGPVGGFPDGLVVVQDDVDQGSKGARQNFKLVDWREVRKALGI